MEKEDDRLMIIIETASLLLTNVAVNSTFVNPVPVLGRTGRFNKLSSKIIILALLRKSSGNQIDS